MNLLQKSGIRELKTGEACELEMQGRRLETTLNAPETCVADEWQDNHPLLSGILANYFPGIFDWILLTQRKRRVARFEKHVVRTSQEIGANAVYMPSDTARIIMGNPRDIEYSEVEFYRS